MPRGRRRTLGQSFASRAKVGSRLWHRYKTPSCDYSRLFMKKNRPGVRFIQTPLHHDDREIVMIDDNGDGSTASSSDAELLESGSSLKEKKSQTTRDVTPDLDVDSVDVDDRLEAMNEECGSQDMSLVTLGDVEQTEPSWTPAIEVVRVRDDLCLAIIDSGKLMTGKSFVTLTKGSVKLTLIHGSVAVNGYDLSLGCRINAFVGLASEQFVSFEPSRREVTTNGNIAGALAKVVYPLVNDDKYVAKQLLGFIRRFVPDTKSVALVAVEKWDDHSEICWTSSIISQSSQNRGRNGNDNWFEFVHDPLASTIDPSWDLKVEVKILSTLTNESVVLILGDSKTGKTNLIKRTLNRMMSNEEDDHEAEQILLLDLDPGQSEFSPPAQVTATLIDISNHVPLLSEPCTHQILYRPKVLASFSCHSVNVMSDPNVYISSVKILINRIKSFNLNIPTFINTMGFVRGAGRDLSIEIIELVQPTHVIEIRNDVSVNGDYLSQSRDFSCSAVLGEGARNWSGARGGRSLLLENEYRYLPLQATGGGRRRIEVNRNIRASQVVAALSAIPGSVFSCLGFLPRIQLDLEKVTIHIVYDSGKFPLDAAIKCLDRAFVQLVRCKLPTEENKYMSTFGDNKVKFVFEVSESEVMAYGILFLQSDEDSDGGYRMEALTTFTDEKEMQGVNCVIKPGGVFLPPHLVQECDWM